MHTKKDIKILSSYLWSNSFSRSEITLRGIVFDSSQVLSVRKLAIEEILTWLDFKGRREEVNKIVDFVLDFVPAIASTKSFRIRQAYILYYRGLQSEAKEALLQIAEDEWDTDCEFALSAILDNDEDRLTRINAAFASNRLSHISRKDKEKPLSYTNIECTYAQKLYSDNQLVSIIVPAYNAASTISTSIESILSQSYDNIEVIIVDDKSTDHTVQVVEEVLKRDSRLKLVRQSENQGAYAARNEGLQHARGELITTHDSDDWSHPEKIARQVSHLTRLSHLRGVITYMVRTKPNLRFTTNWNLSDKLIRLNKSSLMFRADVIQDIGPWHDAVRVSADSEFFDRMTHYYGSESIAKILPEAPLAFALDHEKSLTRAKTTHISSARFGVRHIYRELYLNFHRMHGPDNIKDISRIDEYLPFEIRRYSAKMPEPEAIYQGDCRLPDVIKSMNKSLRTRRGNIGLVHTPQFIPNMRNSFGDSSLHKNYFELIKDDRIVILGSVADDDPRVVRFVRP